MAAAILGSLDADHVREALEHAEKCTKCPDSVRLDIELISKMLFSDVELETDVPAVIKARLMENIKLIPQQKMGVRYDQGGVTVVRSTEVPWQQTRLPGMQWRPLVSGRFDDRTMSIFRMKAGCSFPSHRHEGLEELYILKGTLIVEGMELNAGDDCRAELGTVHSAVVALTDVEFLVSSDATSIL